MRQTTHYLLYSVRKNDCNGSFVSPGPAAAGSSQPELGKSTEMKVLLFVDRITNVHRMTEKWFISLDKYRMNWFRPDILSQMIGGLAMFLFEKISSTRNQGFNEIGTVQNEMRY